MTYRKTLLLASDTGFLPELDNTFFRRMEFEILSASNGKQALELAQRHTPDLIFLELDMLHMNGDECCRFIKNDPKLNKIAVVMVAKQEQAQDVHRCHQAGCDAILIKPIERDAFLATTERLLGVSTRTSRYKTRIKIQYGLDEENLLHDFSADISTGGLFISTRKPLNEGDDLMIKFSIDEHSQEISCQAQVAWVNSPSKPFKDSLPPGMGIRFVNLSLEDLHAIRQFIANKQLSPSW